MNRSLIAYEPAVASVFDEMENLMNGFWTGARAGLARGASRVPAVDIREEKERYVLEAELPGLTEKDVELKVEDGILTLQSKVEEKREERKEGWLLRERSRASFSRAFSLPRDVDAESIKATFRNGLLEVEVPKSAAAREKKIEIKVA
ncbi:MAG: Hsp20/alpha crystallin family protein [Spirochaetales bacterium]|nr:Hsp20/alpha crystallin family protein [Spirochaetales bacterium]